MRRSPAVQIPPGKRTSQKQPEQRWTRREVVGLAKGRQPKTGGGSRSARRFFFASHDAVPACPMSVLWPVLNQARTCDTNLGTKST